MCTARGAGGRRLRTGVRREASPCTPPTPGYGDRTCRTPLPPRGPFLRLAPLCRKRLRRQMSPRVARPCGPHREGPRGGHEGRNRRGHCVAHSVTVRVTWFRCLSRRSLGEQVALRAEGGKGRAAAGTATRESRPCSLRRRPNLSRNLCDVQEGGRTSPAAACCWKSCLAPLPHVPPLPAEVARWGGLVLKQRAVTGSPALSFRY